MRETISLSGKSAPARSSKWLSESGTSIIVERMAVYDGISAHGKPTEPHYYLGVIGVDPKLHGRGVGRQLLESFCQVSANDRMIPPDTERFFAERMQAKKTITLQAGHASLASQGKEIVGLIELAVASVM